MSVRKLTAVMDFQDGEPSDGYMTIQLNAASKTGEALVGPRVWREIAFLDGRSEVMLYPNSELEAGSFYRAQIYVQRTANGVKSTRRILDVVFQMPDEDCFLHDLAAIEPMRPSAEDVVNLAVARAELACAEAERAAAPIAPAYSADIDALFAGAGGRQ